MIHCSQKIFGFLFSYLFGDHRCFKIVSVVLSLLIVNLVHFKLYFTVFVKIKVFFRLCLIKIYHFKILVDEYFQKQLFHFEITDFVMLQIEGYQTINNGFDRNHPMLPSYL